MAMQRMIGWVSGFRVHEAPRVGDIVKNDFRDERSQLLGVLGFCHFDSHVGSASSNQPLSRDDGYRGITQV